VSPFVLHRIQSIAADIFQLAVEKVVPATASGDLEAWSSLDQLSFVLALEQEFGLQFSPEEIPQITSVEQAALLVEEKTQAKWPRA